MFEICIKIETFFLPVMAYYILHQWNFSGYYLKKIAIR
jgi:hypothetical protein